MSRDDDGFLSRWSRRKIEARKAGPEPAPARDAARTVEARPPTPAAEGPATRAPAAAGASAAAAEPPALPPLESLTPHSDFSAFMRADVDPAVKGQALKTLFGDPSLYPMDGLDVYIDDYTRPDPLPEGWLAKLNQFATLHGEPAPGPAREEGGSVPVAETAPADPGVPPAETAGPAPASNTSATSDAAPESKNRGAI